MKSTVLNNNKQPILSFGHKYSAGNSFQKNPIKDNSLCRTPKYDCVSFGSQNFNEHCPEAFENINISKLDKNSKNVLAINNVGYLGEVIKYSGGSLPKHYAIKRLRAANPQDNDVIDAIRQLKQEGEIYKKLNKVENTPKFYAHNNDINLSTNNYIIMSWVDGAMSSKRGVFYDFNLVNTKTIKNAFRIINQFDEAGVLHNDLWAGNILFTPHKTSVIDFDASSTFNPKSEFKLNNLSNFKSKFLHRYFSDVYLRQGEDAYLKAYKECLTFEFDYNKSKQAFYIKNKNMDGYNYYKELNQNLNEELKNPEKMKATAIKTIFDSDSTSAEIFAKLLDFKKDATIFHYNKALNILKNNPQMFNADKASLIKSNIQISTKIKEFMNSQSKVSSDDIINQLKQLDDEKIYSKEERNKPYYNSFIMYFLSLL